MLYKVKSITLIGRLNNINFQALIEVAPEGTAEEELDALFIIDMLTQRAQVAGVQPPVGKPMIEAKGDVWPFDEPGRRIENLIGGNPYPCPNCSAETVLIGGKAKDTGRKWVKVICSNCKFGRFLDNREMRERGF